MDNLKDIELLIRKGYDKESAEEGIKPVLLFLGRTGSGKSSLINEIFGKVSAKTGVGSPVTREFDYYEGDHINIYDSKGLEINDNVDSYINGAFEFIKSKNRLEDFKEHIHFIVYVIPAHLGRIEDGDIHIINAIVNDLTSKEDCDDKFTPPYGGFVILSQCDRVNDESDIGKLKRKLTEKLESGKDLLCGVFTTAVKSSKFYESASTEIKDGTKNLLHCIFQRTPDLLKTNLEWAQQVDIDRKIRFIESLDSKANSIILGAVATASVAAGIPIPVPSSVVITPMQIAMVGSLAKLYGFSPEECKENLLPLVAELAGMLLASQILKIFPALGSVISASVAGTITGGLGYYCKNVFKERALLLVKGEPAEAPVFDMDEILKYINIFKENDTKMIE